jgi:hypothetical protein
VIKALFAKYYEQIAERERQKWSVPSARALRATVAAQQGSETVQEARGP